MTLGRPFVIRTRAATALGFLASSVLMLAAVPATVAQASESHPALVSIGAAISQADAPAGAQAVGPAPSDQRLSVDIVLQPRDPSGLSAFVRAASTPGSASYRHYLARGAFAADFGATTSALDQVSAALRKGGLTVGQPAANRLSIPVSGSVAAFSNALSTAFTTYRTSTGNAIANNLPPKLTAPIADQIAGIVGLDQLTKAVQLRPSTTTAAQEATPALTTGAVSTARPAITTRATSTTLPASAQAQSGPTACANATEIANANGLYTPAQLAQHYGFSSLYAGGDLGQNITVGVIELQSYPASDVTAYQSCYGTHTAVSVVSVDGGSPDDSDILEAASNVEDLIGLAPSSKLVVYEASNTTVSIYADYQQIAQADVANVVSDSWGECEAETGVAGLAADERPLFEQMAAQGQSVLAAAGDEGSEGCYAAPDSTNEALSVWDPASQPEVTAVGGTTLATATSSDTSWSDSSGASGGGISSLWPMPPYQRALGITTDSSSVPCDSTAVPCREVPDVSASADTAHGYLLYVNGKWTPVTGGTSAATSTWAALISLIDATCSSGPIGFVNPALYQLAAAHSHGLVDVTSGPDNDFTNTHGGKYPTRLGYDLTTGLGRPSAVALNSALCPATASAGNGSVTVAPSSVQTGASTTLTFTYNAPAGKGLIDGEIDLTVPGTWSPPSISPLVPGYVTTSAGTLSVDGSTIQVRGITEIANQPVTIVYGDTREGGPGAVAPLTAQASTFSTSDRTTATGTMQPIPLNPAVRVLAANSLGQGSLTRIAGADRDATAVAASQFAYPNADAAGTVVLARNDTFPDALAGEPLAAHGNGPLLLTPPKTLAPATLAEIQRVLAPGRTVYLLGGPTALSPAIETKLQALGYLTSRIAGANRYQTAIDIAQVIGDPSAIFEADGTNFPDVLSAGSAAIAVGGAILLTNGASPVATTTRYASAYSSSARYAIGGPAAHADPTATTIVGTDRYATSAMVASRFFPEPTEVGVASGATFPDALSGGPAIGTQGGPLLLVPPTGNLPASTQAYLSASADSVVSGLLFGGDLAISSAVAREVAQALILVPPSN